MNTTALEKNDMDAIRRRYAEERDKRIRPDGNAQYQRLEGIFGGMAADPYTPMKEREPVNDHVTFAFVGAGLAGLTVGARLREAGITDFRLIEKAGDVGGTWYWNRYPGVRCDTAAMIYLPLLEETGYIPTEKYVPGHEILAHCNRIADKYNLRDKALFHTEVDSIEWLEDQRVWRVQTKRGDDFTAKYLGLGTGPLHIAKLPGIPGIETFEGKAFHTSRWDYSYTGGDTYGAPMDKLADKRVAVIGTGATGVQCIPQLAKTAGQLFVFQRTPSSVDVRNNAKIDPDWFQSIAQPGWQKVWMENFVDKQAAGVAEGEDLVDDGWTEMTRRFRGRVMSLPPEKMTPEGMRAALEEADFEKNAELRRRVEEAVKDAETAEGLKAWYAQWCKRPCFSDEYLDAYNAPNVELVDTDGKGVEAITEKGVVIAGKLYEVDCIVFASGFEVGAVAQLNPTYELKGRGGKLLTEEWSEGMRTLHGLHIRNFPNLFMVQMNQAANLVSNISHNFVDHAKTVSQIVAHAEAEGYTEIEPTEEAVENWIAMVQNSPTTMIGSPDCTPGYYNNEGQGWSKEFRLTRGHPGGPKAYFQHIEQWRASGQYAGLEFSE